MAQQIKPSQRPTAEHDTAQNTPAPKEPTVSQVTMRRYIHSSPCAEQTACSHGPLLRAVEQQNLLLTELLSAVNGLTALLCSRTTS